MTLSLSRKAEGFPESISDDEVDECLEIAAWRKILECSAQGSRTSGPSLRPAAGESFSQGMMDYFAIFPLKINWSHLSEVGECGIAVRWAHSRITP